MNSRRHMPPHRLHRDERYRWPFHQMKVGDFFYVPLGLFDGYENLRLLQIMVANRCNNDGKRHDRKFRTHNTGTSIRVERIA